MSDTGTMLANMTRRLFADTFDDDAMRTAAAGDWPRDAWDAIEAQSVPLALVEGEQGFGVPLAEGLALVRLIGRHAVPLPLAETMVANALLARAGLPVASGPVALIPDGISLRQDGDGWRASGRAERVAWGRNAAALIVADSDKIALVTSGFRTTEQGTNLANMPRDTVELDSPADVAPLPGSLLEAGALVRALAMAGALETVVELTIAHVTERVQFGRALSAFQAVRHSLAQLASQAAAASAAADLAADAFIGAGPAGIAIAAARARISEAAGIAIGIAHQLHGAIGFTEEHILHRYTLRALAWRDDFGSESYWAVELGKLVASRGADELWPLVASR